MENKDKRFIEDTFPVREVSFEGAKEKNIRQGHISTLHIWWARRPLATSRATNLAALIPVPDNEEEKQKTRNFIAELSKWENSNNETLLAKARKMILDANDGVPPKVLDPFGGGGSIPLEALRLGCETYSNDYNPVAVLIQKCTLEYPQKYGKPISLELYKKDRPWLVENKPAIKKQGENRNEDLFVNEPIAEYKKSEMVNPLLEDVKYWGNWVVQKAEEEIGKFYPVDADGATTVGYLWARTIPCQNPTCNAEIPLMRQFWLSNKDSKKVVLYPYPQEGKVQFKIVGGDFTRIDANFDPDYGTVSRAVVNCPVCGSITDDKTTRKLFQQGKASQRIVAVVTHSDISIELKDDVNEIINQLQDDEVPRSIVKALQENNFEVEKKYFSTAVKSAKTFTLIYNSSNRYSEFKIAIKTNKIIIESQGKAYRLATDDDINVYNKTEKYLETKRELLMNEWGIDPVPDEETPDGKGRGAERAFSLRTYGLNTWGSLFNTRQKVLMIIYADLIRKIDTSQIDNNAAKCYLSLNLDMCAAFNNTLCRWENTGQLIKQLYGRQALGIIWDYAEANPFSLSTGSFLNGLDYYLNALKHFSTIQNHANVTNYSATNLSYKDNFFDSIFTDPPYYDNIPYSYLSDFFYVWLKRSIGHIHQDFFSTPLSPKKNEIVAYSNIPGGFDAGKHFFEDMLKKSFQEIHRILKPNGIATIVYAHKSTSGWETVLNALLDSNLVITSSYPLNTEMQVRLRATDSASLSSSIYIIARKLERKGTGFYNEVKDELKNYLNIKLDKLWAEGIVGADFFIAAIGSAIEVFGKYEKVMDFEGNIKRADVLLEDVREMVMNYTIAHILHNGFSGEVSELTKFYVICRFSYGEAKLDFDEANKLARSVGIDLNQEFNKNGFIKKEKEFVRVLSVNNRKIDDLHDKNELIDVLHHSLLLWEAGKKEVMMQLLADTGFGKSEAFFRVAQAISESLAKTSPDSKEKKLLDGFLGGKERIKADIGKTKLSPKKEQQGKLEF